MNNLAWVLIRSIQCIEFPHKLGIIDRLFGSCLEKKVSIILIPVLAYNGNLICVIVPIAGLYMVIMIRHFYRGLKIIFPKDGIVVESGENIDQMTMYLGQYVPKGKLFAFEPGKKQADWLEECLKLNKEALSSVILCRCGLGEKSSSVFLKDTADEIIHGGQSRIDEIEGEPVNLVTLCEFLSEQNLDRIDLWKLDVEGYEIPALEGAKTLLSNHKIGAMVFFFQFEII